MQLNAILSHMHTYTPTLQLSKRNIQSHMLIIWGFFLDDKPLPCLSTFLFNVIHLESIEWFIEGQAFSRSYVWLYAQPLPPPLPSVSLTGDTQETEKEWQLAGSRSGEGSGRGAESYGPQKTSISLNHSLLSASILLENRGWAQKNELA